MNIEQIKALAVSGDTAFHAEGLQAQYDESQLNSKISGSPVFNIFYLEMESGPDSPDGTKNSTFRVVSQYFNSADGSPVESTTAREQLTDYHRVLHGVEKLDATVE
jgi:hypothetical protein